MSLLTMLSCEGCGSTIEPEAYSNGEPLVPTDWLSITGPATPDEIPEHFPHSDAVVRHVCSPKCLGTLGNRLAKVSGAFKPGRPAFVDGGAA